MLTQPLLIGVDYGRDDMTAITIFRRSFEAQGSLHLIACEMRERIYPNLYAMIERMMMQSMRPKGYSHAHWRKVWKQRLKPGFRIVADEVSDGR